MKNVLKSREFYQRAKLTLIPSFFKESFGRVAAESMLCGIPVIGSDRGALPETIGSAGSVITIPPKYTPQTRNLPTSSEAKPWIEEIVKLWDDSEYYERRKTESLNRAHVWEYSKVANCYENLLRRLYSF